MQGLYELKNHEGWSVSRNDELQVMYRHHSGGSVHVCCYAWQLLASKLDQLISCQACMLCFYLQSANKLHMGRLRCFICVSAAVAPDAQISKVGRDGLLKPAHVCS